jgi:hypothetical protein
MARSNRRARLIARLERSPRASVVLTIAGVVGSLSILSTLAALLALDVPF